MKSSIFLALFAAITFLSSCKKDYTCTCSFLGISDSRVINDTKAKATTDCNTGNKNGVSCVIK